jgi:hypothetical protein
MTCHSYFRVLCFNMNFFYKLSKRKANIEQTNDYMKKHCEHDTSIIWNGKEEGYEQIGS